MSAAAASTAITPPTNPPTTTNAFRFPPHYHYPPFFTLQPTASTRLSQMHSWSTLIQSYCRHHRLFALSLVDAVETPLFRNRALGKRLALGDAREVVNWMAGKEGGERAEWVDAGRKGENGGEAGRCWVYWRRPEEWAGLIEGWVDATAQRGTVLTLYELVEGDATRSQEFHGMDLELLQKSLQVLVKRGKAQIFGSDDQQGVKFF